MSTVKIIRPFGDLASFVSGNRPQGGVGQIKEGALSLGGEHVGIDGKLNLSTPKFVPVDYYEANPKGHITTGDILLCKDGALSGKVALERGELSGFQSMVNEHVFIIRADKLDQKYLFYYLFSPVGQRLLKGIVTGAAQGGINGKNLRSIPVVYPDSLSEQQHIVDELDLLTGIIDKKNTQLSDLEALAQSIFYEMFGDPALNEKGWPVVALETIAESRIGLTYKPENVCEEGTIVLRSSNIQESEIDLKDIVRVNSPIKENQYVQEGDILMCSRNGSFKLVGKVAKIGALPERMSYGAFMTTIRSKYNPYLFEFFKLPAFRTQLGLAKTATINQITVKMLANTKVALPPLELQKSFEKRVSSIYAQKASIKQSMKDCQNLLDSRMLMFFND